MDFRNKQNSLGFKVGLGFSSIALVLISALLLIYWQSRYIDIITHNLAMREMPTLQVVTSLTLDVNKSLMQQRISLNDATPRLKEERQNLWKTQIMPTLIQLQGLATLYDQRAEEKEIQAIYNKTLLLRSQQDALDNLSDHEAQESAFINNVTPLAQDLRNDMGNLVAEQQDKLFNNLQQIKTRINFIFSMALGFLCLGVLLSSIMGLVLTRSITRPIDKLVNATRELARGDLKQDFTIVGTYEFEILSNSLNNVVEKLRTIATVADRMAEGDYSQRVEIESEKDQLAIAINQMLENFGIIVTQANAISQGNYTTDIQPRSAIDTLGNALQNMTLTLRQNKITTDEQNWLKDGLAQFANVVGATSEITVLCNTAISEICRYTNAGCGALFLFDEKSQRLSLFGTFALTERNALNNNFRIGEGLVGQAALEHKPILLKSTDNLVIASGTHSETAQSVYCLPILYEKMLIGVLEVAWNHPYNPLAIQYLDSLLPMLASHMQASQQQKVTEVLLHEQKLLAEKLQVQQEELKATNEELEQQTQTLKASEEELRAKDEAQRAINAKLEEKTKELIEQKEQIEKTNNALKKASSELQQKAEELALASKYKSEFLANMSHELRTPLNSLIILAKLLAENKEKNLNTDQVESAQIMLKSGNDLLTLINDILDLAKVEAGKIEAHLGETRLTDFLKTATANFDHVAKEKNIEFKAELEPGLPDIIYTDEQRVSQVVRNLISNAIKFTEQGYVKLSISRATGEQTAKLPKNKNYIAFAVSDTGIGIPSEKQSLVFEAFQQADGTTSRKYGGTGLGLSISTQFAQLLKGAITLESQVGKGSVFTFIIPDNCDELATAGESSPAPVKATPVTRRKEAPPTTVVTESESCSIPLIAKLMLIANNSSQTQIFSRLAEQQGFAVVDTADADEALKKLTETLFAGVIIDLDLETTDALSLLDKLKKTPASAHLPIMVIGSTDDPTSVIKKGAVGYLKKPISDTQLTQALQQIQTDTDTAIRSLLIVEDDLNHLSVIKKLLARANLTIDTAATGTEALYKLQNNDFDCIILDLGLPDISGQEILNKYRKLDKQKQPAIIIYTGKDLSQEDSDSLSQYVDSIILKGSAASMERLQEETHSFLTRVRHTLAKPIHKTEPATSVASLTNKKILLVDDDMRNIYALSKVLKLQGAAIIMAANGKAAIESLEKNPDTALVLMDIMMPVMDGYEAIAKIRENPAIRHIPIIAVTAKTMAGDREKCIEIGATDFLSKPIDIDQLLLALQKWIH